MFLNWPAGNTTVWAPADSTAKDSAKDLQGYNWMWTGTEVGALFLAITAFLALMLEKHQLQSAFVLLVVIVGAVGVAFTLTGISTGWHYRQARKTVTELLKSDAVPVNHPLYQLLAAAVLVRMGRDLTELLRATDVFDDLIVSYLRISRDLLAARDTQKLRAEWDGAHQKLSVAAVNIAASIGDRYAKGLVT